MLAVLDESDAAGDVRRFEQVRRGESRHELAGDLLRARNVRELLTDAERRASRAHASLAELLLPAAFVDIAAKHREGGSVHGFVSAGVKLCLEADGGGCARATRALLGALDAMRFRSAAAMRRPAASDAKRSSSEGRRLERAENAREARLPSPPERWRRVYWVEVDYLVAAKAARRARAPLTATLLTEAWLEDRHGVVSLDEAAAAEDAAADAGAFAANEERVPEHVGVLLEAQASLSEPDGIYGLLRSNALPVQLRLYEHEGAWGQALAGFDMGARRRAGVPRQRFVVAPLPRGDARAVDRRRRSRRAPRRALGGERRDAPIGFDAQWKTKMASARTSAEISLASVPNVGHRRVRWTSGRNLARCTPREKLLT